MYRSCLFEALTAGTQRTRQKRLARAVYRDSVQLAEAVHVRRELTSRAHNLTQQPTHMLAWSDLPPFFQNLAIVVGFVAVATYVDILLPRAGPVKLDDPHAHYVADKDYNGSWRRKKDE